MVCLHIFLTLKFNIMSKYVSKINNGTEDLIIKDRTGELIHYVKSVSGTAGAKNVRRTRWTGVVDNITELYTGLTISIKAPLAGVNVGVTLNINSLGEHPLVFFANTIVTIHFPVGSIIILTYDAAQTATVIIDSVVTTITGCWKISNFNSNTTYSDGTTALLEAGTDTKGKVWPSIILHNYIKEKNNELQNIIDVLASNGHDYVEIGGLKWATMNIGAYDPIDIGAYFQWGDTHGYTSEQIGSEVGKKTFSWTTYKYSRGIDEPTESDMSKYNSVDGKTTLDLSDDAARVNWGGLWRTPTVNEYQTLLNSTNLSWTDNYKNSGVKGVILTDNSDSSKELFFPCNGHVLNNNIESPLFLFYQTANVNTEDYRKEMLTLGDYSGGWFGTNQTDGRWPGCGIRAVIG